MKRICLFFICLMGLFIVQAQTIVGKVVKVTDGDTFTLLTEAKEQVKIRMYGIDAPEKKGGQPFSEAFLLYR